MFFCFRNPAMKPLLLILLLLFPAASVWAKDEPPPPPPPVQEGEEQLEPEVTIRQQGSRTIHEYRINGQLYMVKIVPRKGPPYYLRGWSDGHPGRRSHRCGRSPMGVSPLVENFLPES